MADGVGATGGVVPLAFLAATRDELVLCGNRGTYRFPRTAIVKITRGKFYPWLFRSVRIHHAIAAYPAELQFKPMRTTKAEVLARLEQLGFGVA